MYKKRVLIKLIIGSIIIGVILLAAIAFVRLVTLRIPEGAYPIIYTSCSEELFERHITSLDNQSKLLYSIQCGKDWLVNEIQLEGQIFIGNVFYEDTTLQQLKERDKMTMEEMVKSPQEKLPPKIIRIYYDITRFFLDLDNLDDYKNDMAEYKKDVENSEKQFSQIFPEKGIETEVLFESDQIGEVGDCKAAILQYTVSNYYTKNKKEIDKEYIKNYILPPKCCAHSVLITCRVRSAPMIKEFCDKYIPIFKCFKVDFPLPLYLK